MHATAPLGAQGRLVIPAEIRAELGLEPGDVLHLHVSGGRLILTTAEHATTMLRRLGSSVVRERSLVDELLAERRAEARRA